jgi:exodeoxyribonuclease V beta subunit
MEFTLPVASGTTRAAPLLTSVALARALSRNPRVPRSYTDTVSQLGFGPLRGFLRGFIDLVFEHAGRFYVVDYKSNHLGPHPEDYREERLQAPMSEHHYFLQYHLYSVAVHRHLSQRLPGYDYERHFGGVYYLFLRGMDPARGPATGVFFDRPDASVVKALSDCLARPSGGSP